MMELQTLKNFWLVAKLFAPIWVEIKAEGVQVAWNVATTIWAVSHAYCPKELVHEPSWVCVRSPCASRAVKLLIYLNSRSGKILRRSSKNRTQKTYRELIKSKCLLQRMRYRDSARSCAYYNHFHGCLDACD